MSTIQDRVEYPVVRLGAFQSVNTEAFRQLAEAELNSHKGANSCERLSDSLTATGLETPHSKANPAQTIVMRLPAFIEENVFLFGGGMQ